MSLSARLRIAILLLALAGFGGSLIGGISPLRDALVQEHAARNANAATLLALLLPHTPPDAAVLTPIVETFFRDGGFVLVRIRHGDRTLVEKRADSSPGVPPWFATLFELDPAPGIANLQDSDRVFATVTVTTNPHMAYRALWRATLALALWFAVGGLVVATIVHFALRRSLRPVDALVEQAGAIARQHFPVAEVPSPSLRELAPLVRAMNTLAHTADEQSRTERTRFEELDHRVGHDELTGLPNRNRFLTLLDSALTIGHGETPRNGTLALMRVTDLVGLNRSLGRTATDRLLCDIAARLRGVAALTGGRVAARLNGSDFILLAPDQAVPQLLANELSHALAALQAVHGDGLLRRLPIGVAGYASGEPRARMLARLDGALAAAEHAGWGDAHFADGHDHLPARTDLAGWREALVSALDNGQVSLDLFPVLARDGSLLYYEAPARVLIDDLWYGAESFVAWAERLGLTERLDLVALRLGLDRIEAEEQPVGVHLSATSIRSAGFLDALRAELAARPETAARLWIELPEQGVVRDLAAFRALCLTTQPWGCRLGIEHAGREFGQLGGLHDIGLDYIKIDGGFVDNVASNQDKRDFITRICDLGHAIGLQVIAEGVDRADDLAVLGQLGLDGTAGSAVRL